MSSSRLRLIECLRPLLFPLVQQALRTLEQRQGDERPEAAVAQAEPARLAEALRSLLELARPERDQAGQEDCLAQGLVELPGLPPLGVEAGPPPDRFRV